MTTHHDPDRFVSGVLHVHSAYSHDGKDTIPELRKLALARGIGFVALADHAEDLDAERYEWLRRECAESSDESVQIIPGLEFRFAGYPGLHLLALDLSEWIAPETPEVFMDLAPARSELTVAAHPCLYRHRLPERVTAGIDAIAVWNAACNTRYLPEPRAITLLNRVRRSRPEVVGVAALDQHDGANDRRVRVILKGPTTAPLQAIRAGHFLNLGLTMDFPATVGWSPLRLGALYGVRMVYDSVEWVQEQVSLALAARARHRPGKRSPAFAR